MTPEQITFFHEEVEDATKNKGLTGQNLRKYLENFGKAYFLNIPQETILEVVNNHPDPVNPIELAIASGDVKEVLNVAPLLAQLTPLELGIAKQQIKERFGKQINMNDLTSAIKDEQRRIKLQQEGLSKDVADIARDWAMANRERYAYDTDTQVWRRWNGTTHWEELENTGLLDLEAEAALQDAGQEINSVSKINLFIRQSQARLSRTFEAEPSLINCVGGVFDVDGMELRQYHSQDDNFTSCLPYTIYPDGDYPVIRKFLFETITDTSLYNGGKPDFHAIQAVMAHIGLGLLRDKKMHKALIAQGLPRTGKTTVIDLINMACGISPGNFVPYDVFSRDAEGKRVRYAHRSKTIACVDEVPVEALREEEIFKAMTSHSSAGARGMYKNDETNPQWTAKLAMTCNEYPHYKDVSGAIKQRLLVIQCPTQRPEEPEDGKLQQDKELAEKMHSELGAFVYHCLRMAKLTLARGYYPQSALMRNTLEDVAVAGNPLKSAVEEVYVLDPTAHTLTPTLYPAYQEYCNYRGHDALGISKFGQALCAMGIGVTAKKLRGERALVGIRLRNINEPIPEKAELKATALLEEWTSDGRLMDGKINQTSNDEMASQATSEEQWTSRTSNLEKTILSDNTFTLNGNAKVGANMGKEDSLILTSQPSTDGTNGHHKPSDGVDVTQYQTSTNGHNKHLKIVSDTNGHLKSDTEDEERERYSI